ncbi:4'-phosphopantetheinyl transferase superfamily protein [Methylovirgula sp. HY1]|uniref:4'-phosphopantetheinyl transferase family protein n=1 Tax=Methylovirgula sp. HY1 TaxID=2822761 RepID=UPI001C5AD3BE|nr:4'-phosphopantetheinyl transferase superfamily protein [Methylovirgula sp. HY1]QXX76206.1 4'-phosphopantetheinyl transferase sfp [Methylovirgula sp. HY1]
MPVASETIFWTRDFSAAARAPRALVLLADVDDPALRGLTSLPPKPEDLARASAYRDARRGYFLARRALMRQLVARRLGCAAEAVTIAVDAAGAPCLGSATNGPELFVSIARRGALAVLAIAPRPIGVDLELLGPPEAIPTAVLHDAEAQHLAPMDAVAQHRAFLEIWTLKEAYLKALRTGLTREPAEIEVRREKAQIRLYDRGRPVVPATCESRRETFGGKTVVAACVML